jgi:hypothetical protein
MQLFDIVDLHLREALCPDEMRAHYPLLCQHHERIKAIPSIAQYLGGPRRQSQIVANGLG